MTSDVVEAEFLRAGLHGWLHAVDLDSGAEVSFRADEQVVIASIFKILLVLEFARQVEDGRLDPTERVLTTAPDRLGGWGIAGCADDVELSLRDLAYFAMTVSDNTAADLLLAFVGLESVALLAGELGLARTRIVGGPRDVLRTVVEDLGALDSAELVGLYPPLSDERIRGLRMFDPDLTTSSTPRDITSLLAAIWADAAGSGPCALVRGLMAQQVFATRLASGFPPGTRVSAKTGTLPGLHMEAGVVELPDGGRYALAVFGRSRQLISRNLQLDLALGRAARHAVDGLRRCRVGGS